MTEIGKMIRDEALQEGFKKGKQEEKISTLLKLLTKKFGKVPPEYSQKIKELPEDTIDIITLSIFEMNNLKELEKYF